MNNSNVYGSITIQDLGDLTKLSVFVEHESPETIQKSGNRYYPNWEVNNLVLKPRISIGNYDLATYTSYKGTLTISWYVKDSITNTEQLIWSKNTFTSADDWNLIISENVEQPCVITYICKVSYERYPGDKAFEEVVYTKFNIINQPDNLSSCTLKGENAFLYGSNNELKNSNANTITLTAVCDECTVTGWYYLGSDNTTYYKITAAGNADTLTVDHQDSTIFINDKATIKVVAQNEHGDELFDIHIITKLRDGAAGTDIISIVLSNEDIDIACDKDGNPLDGAFNAAKTRLIVYEGNTDITNTSELEITATDIEYTTSQADDNVNHTIYAITNILNTSGSLEFKITHNGRSFYKYLYVTKVTAGQDGSDPIIYSLKVSSLVVNKKGTSINPSSYQASAYMQVGSGVEQPWDGGTIVIYGVIGSNYTQLQTYSGSSLSLPISGGQLYTSYVVKLFHNNVTDYLTTIPLDQQTIVVVNDGEKGDDAISFLLQNPVAQIVCDEDGSVAYDQLIEVPYAAYEGGAAIDCYIRGINLKGLSEGRDIEYTYDKDAQILSLTFLAASHLDSVESGIIELTIQSYDPEVTQTVAFNWVKSKQGATGDNAVLLRLPPKDSVIIHNKEEESVTIEASITDGYKDVTNEVTNWDWQLWDVSKQWLSIAAYSYNFEANNNILTVKQNAVDGELLLRVKATYEKITYEAETNIIDKFDPIQVEIISTLGDRVVEGKGYGCLYTKIYRNGIELDPWGSVKIGISEPNSAAIIGVDNDVYLQLDSDTNPTAISNIYQYKTNSWKIISTDKNQVSKVSWVAYDKDGNLINTLSNGNSRAILIKASDIVSKGKNKITYQCQVQAKGNSTTSYRSHTITNINRNGTNNLGNYKSLEALKSLHPENTWEIGDTYYNTSEFKSYIWDGQQWDIFVESIQTTVSSEAILYKAYSTDETNVSIDASETGWSEAFPQYDAATPEVWKATKTEYKDNKNSPTIVEYSAPILVDQFTCIENWAKLENMDLGSWCAKHNVSVVGKGMIATGAVTADTIAANAITADKMNVNSLAAISGNLGSIKTGSIQSENYKRVPVIWQE